MLHRVDRTALDGGAILSSGTATPFELIEVVAERDARTDVARANVRIDGDQIYGPAITTYLQMGQPIGTPSVNTGLTHDIYLTIAGTNAPLAGSDTAVLEVFNKPLILWMWIVG